MLNTHSNNNHNIIIVVEHIINIEQPLHIFLNSVLIILSLINILSHYFELLTFIWFCQQYNTTYLHGLFFPWIGTIHVDWMLLDLEYCSKNPGICTIFIYLVKFGQKLNKIAAILVSKKSKRCQGTEHWYSVLRMRIRSTGIPKHDNLYFFLMFLSIFFIYIIIKSIKISIKVNN